MSVKSLLIYLVALVWLVNGLFCKVLNLVPRHTAIVGQILGDEHARALTVLIGLSEMVMAIWVWSRYHSKLNAWTQIVVVGVMNVLEFFLVPDLLLWGRGNFFFAFVFMALVYFYEFMFEPSHPWGELEI